MFQCDMNDCYQVIGILGIVSHRAKVCGKRYVQCI